jgi:hypothetical protein
MINSNHRSLQASYQQVAFEVSLSSFLSYLKNLFHRRPLFTYWQS